MQKVLVVIDMQNDFVDGALGSTQAQMIVDNVRKKIESFDGPIIFTRDTHDIDYLERQEGKNVTGAALCETYRGLAYCERLN